MVKFTPKSASCVAGSGRLLLYVVLFMEFLVGGVFVAFGFSLAKAWLLAIGAAVAAIALMVAAASRLAPPGEVLISVSPRGIMMHPLTGVGADFDGYDWLHSAELVERAGQHTLLLLPLQREQWIASLPLSQSRRAAGLFAKYGAPIAVNESDLEHLGVNKPNLEAICNAINRNLILDRLKSLSEPELLSSEMVIDEHVTLFMTGIDASLSGEGLCLKIANREDIWLFPDAALSKVSLMAGTDNQHNLEVVLILLYGRESFVLVSSTDGVYPHLLDSLVRLRGFDTRGYNRACQVADNALFTCYTRE